MERKKNANLLGLLNKQLKIKKQNSNNICSNKLPPLGSKVDYKKIQTSFIKQRKSSFVKSFKWNETNSDFVEHKIWYKPNTSLSNDVIAAIKSQKSFNQRNTTPVPKTQSSKGNLLPLLSLTFGRGNSVNHRRQKSEPDVPQSKNKILKLKAKNTGLARKLNSFTASSIKSKHILVQNKPFFVLL